MADRKIAYRKRKNAAMVATNRTSTPITYLFAEIQDGES